MEVCEEKVHSQGKLICEGRGQQWPNPEFVYDQTITKTDMRTRLEELQQLCMQEAECGCYDLAESQESEEF